MATIKLGDSVITLVESKKNASRRQQERLALREKETKARDEDSSRLRTKANKMFTVGAKPESAVKPKVEKFKNGGTVTARGQGRVTRNRPTRIY